WVKLLFLRQQQTVLISCRCNRTEMNIARSDMEKIVVVFSDNETACVINSFKDAGRYAPVDLYGDASSEPCGPGKPATPNIAESAALVPKRHVVDPGIAQRQEKRFRIHIAA